MTVTSAQVAKAAGVSRATVSYVLNDAPGQTISPTTRELVQRTARELGYRPSAAARSLRSGKGVSVLLPMPGMASNYILTQLVDACTSALNEVGHSLVPDHALHASTDEQLDAWLRLAPSAVVDIALRHDDPVREGLRRHRVPVLSTSLGDGTSWDRTSDRMVSDVRVTQVQHLLDQGCRSLVAVVPAQLPRDSDSWPALVRRLKALAKARGAVLTVVKAPLDALAVRAVVDGWDRTQHPDAVVAYNDDYALAVMTALQSRGLRVPDDVRVMGVDDLPVSSFVTPTLTTVSADFTAYAAGVAAAVLHAVNGGRTPPPLPVPDHHVVVRESA